MCVCVKRSCALAQERAAFVFPSSAGKGRTAIHFAQSHLQLLRRYAGDSERYRGKVLDVSADVCTCMFVSVYVVGAFWYTSLVPCFADDWQVVNLLLAYSRRHQQSSVDGLSDVRETA